MRATRLHARQSQSHGKPSSNGNGNLEDNHGDTIVNQVQLNSAISSAIGIPALVNLVKAQSEKIAGLEETVKQLNSKVDKQSQLIDGIMKGMKSSLAVWESVRTENGQDEGDIPSGSTSGRDLSVSPTRVEGQPCSQSTAPKKRGRPRKQHRLLRMATIASSSESDDDELVENTVLDHEDEEQPITTSVGIPRDRSASSVEDGAGNDYHDSDWDPKVKGTVSPCRKRRRSVSENLKSKFKKSGIIREKGKHRCDQCGKFYKTRGILKTHIQAIHADNRRYECANCHGKFARLGLLKIHSRVHNRDDEGRTPLEKCAVCGMEVKGRVGLVRHMIAAHKKRPPPSPPVTKKGTQTSGCVGGDSSFQCPGCAMAFNKREILRCHLDICHHGASEMMEVEVVLENVATGEVIGKV